MVLPLMDISIRVVFVSSTTLIPARKSPLTIVDRLHMFIHQALVLKTFSTNVALVGLLVVLFVLEEMASQPVERGRHKRTEGADGRPPVL